MEGSKLKKSTSYKFNKYYRDLTSIIDPKKSPGTTNCINILYLERAGSQ